MANSKYTYVKDFEIPDKCLPNCWIVVRVDGRGFSKFAEKHKFKKPNDPRSLHLMTLSAKKVMRDYNDIILAYGHSDEYSFVFKKNTTVYNRRVQKLVSLIASSFTGHYIVNWNSFFISEYLSVPPTFDGRVVLLPSDDNLRDYLSWRQVDAHINNLYNTCFWNLIVKKKITATEAELVLKGTVSKEKHEILHSALGINYNNEPEEFKKGTTIIRGKNKNYESFNVDIIKDQFWIEHKELLGTVDKTLPEPNELRDKEKREKINRKGKEKEKETETEAEAETETAELS